MKVSLSIVLALLILGCGEDVKKEPLSAVQNAQEMPKEERVKELKERIVEPVQAATIQRTIAPTPLKTGETIYKACGNCHGANAQKAALNKSQIIQGWNAEKIADALNGYKEGSYGGAMKAVMNTQASKLSDSEIHLVSEYISKL